MTKQRKIVTSKSWKGEKYIALIQYVFIIIYMHKFK